jgi:hypothetical protein
LNAVHTTNELSLWKIFKERTFYTKANNAKGLSSFFRNARTTFVTTSLFLNASQGQAIIGRKLGRLTLEIVIILYIILLEILIYIVYKRKNYEPVATVDRFVTTDRVGDNARSSKPASGLAV